jgi:hypothetical protein
VWDGEFVLLGLRICYSILIFHVHDVVLCHHHRLRFSSIDCDRYLTAKIGLGMDGKVEVGFAWFEKAKQRVRGNQRK